MRFHEWEAAYLDSRRCTEPVRARDVVDRDSPSLATADFDDERLRLAKRSTPMGEGAGEPTELRRTGVGEVDVDRCTHVLEWQESGAAPIDVRGRDLRVHLPFRVVDPKLDLLGFVCSSASTRSKNEPPRPGKHSNEHSAHEPHHAPKTGNSRSYVRPGATGEREGRRLRSLSVDYYPWEKLSSAVESLVGPEPIEERLRLASVSLLMLQHRPFDSTDDRDRYVAIMDKLALERVNFPKRRWESGADPNSRSHTR